MNTDIEKEPDTEDMFETKKWTPETAKEVAAPVLHGKPQPKMIAPAPEDDGEGEGWKDVDPPKGRKLPAAKAAPAPKPEAKPKSPKADKEPKAEAKPKAAPKAKAEPKAKAKPAPAKPKAEPKAKPAPKAKAAPAPKAPKPKAAPAKPKAPKADKGPKAETRGRKKGPDKVSVFIRITEDQAKALDKLRRDESRQNFMIACLDKALSKAS